MYVNNNRSLLGGRQSFINIYVIVGRSQVSTSKRQAFHSFQSKLLSVHSEDESNTVHQFLFFGIHKQTNNTHAQVYSGTWASLIHLESPTRSAGRLLFLRGDRRILWSRLRWDVQYRYDKQRGELWPMGRAEKRDWHTTWQRWVGLK